VKYRLKRFTKTISKNAKVALERLCLANKFKKTRRTVGMNRWGGLALICALPRVPDQAETTSKKFCQTASYVIDIIEAIKSAFARLVPCY
jgi:hypothetical protein